MNTKYNSINQGLSYKSFVITKHAQERFYERLGISGIKNCQKAAMSAKLKGVKLNNGRSSGYCGSAGYMLKECGVDQDTIDFIKTRFRADTNSNVLYWYKGNIYVFVGHKSRTLKTVISINNEKVSGWVNSGKKQIRRGL